MSPSLFKAAWQDYLKPNKYKSIAKLASSIHKEMSGDSVHSSCYAQMLDPIKFPPDLDFTEAIVYNQKKLSELFESQLGEAKDVGVSVIYDVKE